MTKIDWGLNSYAGVTHSKSRKLLIFPFNYKRIVSRKASEIYCVMLLVTTAYIQAAILN